MTTKPSLQEWGSLGHWLPRNTCFDDVSYVDPDSPHLPVPVATVVGMVADSMSVSDILHEHLTLEPQDIPEALRYAAGGRTRTDDPSLRVRFPIDNALRDGVLTIQPEIRER